VLERYEKARTGTDKSEALNINKPEVKEVKELDKAPKKKHLQRSR
jgi:hypothetical protein